MLACAQVHDEVLGLHVLQLDGPEISLVGQRRTLLWSMWARRHRLWIRRSRSSEPSEGSRTPVPVSSMPVMANIKSQIKRNKQNEKRRVRNKNHLELRTWVKAAEAEPR